MRIPDWIEKGFHRGVDGFFEHRRQPFPGRERLRACRLVAHRGEHDNRRVLENTLEAFDRSRAAGVWGIELDVRWTRDLEPVVFHDRDLRRLFASPTAVAQTRWRDLRRKYPMIPSLAHVVERYGGRLHLMLEIKTDAYSAPARQNRILEGLLRELAPGADFHLLALEPAVFARIAFVPRTACIPIARLNVRSLSALALTAGYGGLDGHYLFMGHACIARHHRQGQQVGTGFVNSVNCLLREVGRGVDWIFSNRAAALQRACDRLSADRSSGSRCR